MNHPIKWQAPQPLWGRFGATPAAGPTAADQERPVILRFTTDEFMPQLLGTLARDPSRLDQLIARPETWRHPPAAGADLVERTPVPQVAQEASRRRFSLLPKPRVAATASEVDLTTRATTRKLPLKLYQPAHQRFYLVASSLVCGVPGLPEKGVEPGGAERVDFVLRRLLPATPNADPADLREFAYVKDEAGAHWQRVTSGADADAGVPIAGEELLPVFRLVHTDEASRQRGMWTGMIPVGRREEYVSASVVRTTAPPFNAGQRQSLQPATPAAPLSKQARVAQFQFDVAEPWKNLIRSSVKAQSSESQVVEIDGNTEPADPARKPQRIFDHNLQQQNTSWLILLDFADYLSDHLDDLWATIESNGAGYADLSQDRKNLYDWLGTA
ncbi:MAG TPA: hypothetical protein VN923_07855, partial [Thermoanaerobaculia bacterium]|nr:hypothetical protein [Thermoanaerobaculia bacterium]